MTYEENKTNKNSKITSSQESLREKTNTAKSISKGKSIPDAVYQNSLENLKSIIELKKNLEKGDYNQDLKTALLAFQKKKEELSELYENEENMKKMLQEDSDLNLNNDLFEERTLKILSDVYGLKEYNLYPFFDFGFSKTKKTNVIKIYFNQIDVSVENEESTFSALFLDDLDTYMFQFLEMPMIFHKYNGDFFTLTVISKDFKNSIDFNFKKGDTNEKVTTTSFIFAELNDDLMETKNKIKELKNEKDSSNDNAKKELCDKKLESYQKILKLKENIYSQTNIEMELDKKRNELSILEERETIREIEDKEEKLKKKEEEEKRKNKEEEKRRKEEDEKRKKEEEDKNKEGEEKRKKEVKEDKKKEDEEKRKREQKAKEKKEDEEKRKKEEEEKIKKEEEEKRIKEQKAKEKKEDEEKKIKIMEDIHNYEKLLKKITFRIEQIDKEIDGLFFTSKEIILENTIGDKLKIPQEKAIIVEVKNINKYKTMVENIRIKKKLMSTLGFKTEDLFFVGILRGIDVDEKKKKEINDKYYKELNMQNMIVIYAEKFNFLNVPLIQVKNEKKEKPKEDANLYSMFLDLKRMLTNQSNDINELKKDVNLLKEKIK